MYRREVLDEFRVAKLQQILKTAGSSITGKRLELVDRILQLQIDRDRVSMSWTHQPSPTNTPVTTSQQARTGSTNPDASGGHLGNSKARAETEGLQSLGLSAQTIEILAENNFLTLMDLKILGPEELRALELPIGDFIRLKKKLFANDPTATLTAGTCGASTGKKEK